MSPLRLIAPAIALASTVTSPAFAELPDPVRDMVDAALKSGDPKKVDTVIEIAKQTNPDDAEELETIHQTFKDEQARLAEKKAREHEQAIRTAGVLQNWSGSGEIGAFYSSGNSDDVGLTVGIELLREGIDWSHKLRATADYQRSDGTTSREQFVAAYEPRYQINNGLFAYGLAQFERDPFQGFSGRYAVSGGLGYKIVDSEGLSIAAKLGPAFRRTVYVDGTSESRLAGLAGLDFDWQITDRLKLTQDTNMVAETGGQATVIFDSTNTSVLLVTGLEAKISNRLSTRLSVKVDYNSSPPEGSVSTDTLSRFTLIYGF